MSDNVIAEIRALILELELCPRHLLLTRVRLTNEDDVVGHERERRVRIVLREMQAHGLGVHDVCTGWMLPPTPDSTCVLERETAA
jgi:hypothetical protein